jgi:hypothetical protein
MKGKIYGNRLPRVTQVKTVGNHCLKPSLDSVTFDFGIAMTVHLENAINSLFWNNKAP